MPQPGDGNVWPNTDGDKSRDGAPAPARKASAPVDGAKTSKLPVPDQEEKPSSGGWFDPPTADEPAKGSEKSHPKPAQQRTQPVSWPVAELEKQAKGTGGESTVIVRAVELKPPPSNATQAATAFASPPKPDKSGPAWPAGDKSTRSSGPEKTDPPKAADRGWFDSPTESPAANDASAEKPETPEKQDAPGPEAVEQDALEEQDATAERAEPEDEQPQAEVEQAEVEQAEPAAEEQPPTEQEADGTPPAPEESEEEAAAESQPAPEEGAAAEDAAEAPAASEGATVTMAVPTVEPSTEEPDAEPAPTADQPESATDEAPEPDPDVTQAVSWPTESPTAGAKADSADAPREPAPEQGKPEEPAKGGHDLAWPSVEPSGATREGDRREPAALFRPAVDPAASETEPERPEEDAANGTASTVFRPVTDPKSPERQERQDGGSHLGTPPGARPAAASGSESATSVFRPVEPPRTDRQPKENPPAALFRPPGQRPKPPQGVDGPTVNYLRPVQPPKPPENPPSFVRPRQPPTETVNLARPPERQGDWPPPEPPRAAPQRVGPQPEEPRTRQKSKKKPLLIAAVAIVAVIGIAAGVVFGVPGLAEKLGLKGTDTVAVAPPPGPITYTPGLHGPAGSAPTPTRQGVEQAIAGPMANPALGTITGVVIDPATGEALYERDAGKVVTPASTGKLLTAAAALLSLDHSYQLVTKVVQGDQPGEVIIVGGGDPTISSLEPGDDDSVYKGAAHLTDLVNQVKASGAQVNTVYIDQSRYAAPHMAPSWLPEDVGAGYIAPIVPAMLDGDRRDATQNYSSRTNDPGRTLVDEFARRVGASAAGSIEKKAPANAKVLGEIRSAPVSQLVDNMLDHSENTLGDVLAHEVAIKAGQEPTFDGAAKAMLDILRQNKFDVDGVVLKDGSGMSTQNKVSAKLLAQILAVAAGPDGKDERTAKLRPLLGGLPVAGGSGTLEDRYDQGASTEGRGWVRAKTGTLTGVNSLAGIVLDKDNRPLIFAFLTSGTEGSTARPALDTVAAALRGCGCQ